MLASCGGAVRPWNHRCSLSQVIIVNRKYQANTWTAVLWGSAPLQP